MEDKSWSVWSIFREQIADLIRKNPGFSKTEIARTCIMNNNIEFTYENVEGLRRYISRHYDSLSPMHVSDVTESVTRTETNQYEKNAILSARKPDGGIMSAEEFCKTYGLPYHETRSYKLITHLKYPTYNIASHDVNVHSALNLDDYEKVLSKFYKAGPCIAPLSPLSLPSNDGELVSRLVISDVHIGMGYPSYDESMYSTSWGKEDIERRLNLLIDHVIKNKGNSSYIIVDDLGDFMDNYNGYTSRGGHQVPQGMNTMDAFDLGLSFKVRLAMELKLHFDDVVFNNVCNDNHGGVLSYLVNSAFARVVNEFAIVNNHRKFMSHYFVGNHAFILCHGKDAKYMKFPMKPHPDKNDISKVEEYIRMNDFSNGMFVEFSKGDSHLGVFDFSSSDTFDYLSYPAFSPSSDWVMHNYKFGQSGFVFQQFNPYEKAKQISYFRY